MNISSPDFVMHPKRVDFVKDLSCDAIFPLLLSANVITNLLLFNVNMFSMLDFKTGNRLGSLRIVT